MADYKLFIVSSILLAGLIAGASQLQKMHDTGIAEYITSDTTDTLQLQPELQPASSITTTPVSGQITTVVAPAPQPTTSAPKSAPSPLPRTTLPRRLYGEEDD